MPRGYENRLVWKSDYVFSGFFTPNMMKLEKELLRTTPAHFSSFCHAFN